MDEGRLRSQLEEVAREDDTHTRIIKLRRIFFQLQTDAAKFVHLWPSFLDVFFDRHSVHVLTIDDVYNVERVGDTLLATSCQPEDIWSRAVLAYTLRGEEFQARSLLTRMFGTPSVHPSCKDWVAVELARRGAQDTEHLTIYMQYLYHVTTLDHATEMINLLKPICIVDFSSPLAQIEQAGKIASCFIYRQIWVTGVWKAKALHTLLIEQKPAEAVKQFAYALQENMQDSAAFCGLLAASIQCKKYSIVTEAVRLTEQIVHPLADALVKVGIVLQWLDNRYGMGTPLYTAQKLEDLKTLDIQTYVGDTLDVAIGRLHLLEGNARQAAAILRPVANKHPEWPELHYYVAWADVLLDEHRDLEERFLSLATWPGQWTVATLLLDANPNAAEIYPLWSCLEEKRNMKHHLTSVISARMALTRGQAPEDISWKLNADSLLEEDMEALRTAIGCAIYMRDGRKVERLIELPLFQHLPLADQLLWRGLHCTISGQDDQGRTYLENAVNKHGYRRAALVLAVYYLEREMLSKAKYSVERASTVHTEKIVRLRTFIKQKEVKPFDQQEITSTAQKHSSKTRETNPRAAERYVAGLVDTDVTNGSLALFLASIYLTSNKTDLAVAVLKRVRPLDRQEQKLCVLFAALLEEQNVVADEISPLHAQINPEVRIAYDVLKALVAYKNGSSASASKIILAAFVKDQSTTTSLVKIKHLLPYLCAAAIQEKTLILKQVQIIAKSSGETKDMVTLARYLTASGKIEEADHVWRMLIERVDTKSRPLRQEFAQLLCYISATNYNNGNILTAKQKLSKALSWSNVMDEKERYRKLVSFLESRLALHNLLTILFPAMDEAYILSGRYYGFIRFIKYFGQIRGHLIDEYGKRTHAELARSVQEKMALYPDVRLNHLQAVIYRDVALDPKHFMQDAWEKSTTLWMVLLCNEAFWAYFSVARGVNKQGERENLDKIEQDCLFYDAVNSIFSEHMARAKQAFAAGHYEDAKIHLHCLALCQKGEEALITTLQEYHLTTYPFSLDPFRIDEMKHLASKIFKEWSDALVREAEKATKDRDALETLAVSMNFAGGIHVLETFIALDIPILHVLTTCLHWYNSWRDDLWRLGAYWQVINLTSSANQIADRLIPLCTRSMAYRKENQVLSEHFFLRGFFNYDRNQRMEWYREALAWNPTHSIAQMNLEKLEEEERQEENDDGYEDDEDNEDEDKHYENDDWW
jgi:hypothetical protein